MDRCDDLVERVASDKIAGFFQTMLIHSDFNALEHFEIFGKKAVDSFYFCLLSLDVKVLRPWNRISQNLWNVDVVVVGEDYAVQTFVKCRLRTTMGRSALSVK